MTSTVFFFSSPPIMVFSLTFVVPWSDRTMASPALILMTRHLYSPFFSFLRFFFLYTHPLLSRCIYMFASFQPRFANRIGWFRIESVPPPPKKKVQVIKKKKTKNLSRPWQLSIRHQKHSWRIFGNQGAIKLPRCLLYLLYLMPGGCYIVATEHQHLSRVANGQSFVLVSGVSRPWMTSMNWAFLLHVEGYLWLLNYI